MSQSSSWPLADEAFDSGRGRPGPLTIVLLASILGASFGLGYDYWVIAPGESLVHGWDPTPLDWLFIYALVGATVSVVLIVRRFGAVRIASQLISDRRALVATALLASTIVLGFAGPIVYGTPGTAPNWVDENPREPAPNQPPVGFSIDRNAIAYCSGPTSADRCFGTWRHPLGTTIVGEDVLAYVFLGMRVTTKFLLVGAMLMIPLAVTVGVTAGAVGGRVDAALMRYVDLQQSMPLFLLIIVMLFIFGTSFWPILIVFGLLNWGSMARTIRSETLAVMTQGYLRSAESSGASMAWRIRRHVVPNVLHTISVAVGARLSLLVLLEALLTYLGLADLVAPSYGMVLTTSIAATGSQFPTTQWWTVLVVTGALAATIVSLNLAGDAYRDILAPQT